MNDDLSTLLHDRLAASIEQSHPDLDRIADGAARRGRRTRFVRRAGVSLGAVAAVAAVGMGVASISGSTPSAAPQYANSGGSAPLQGGQQLDLGNGITGTVVKGKPSGTFYDLGGSAQQGAGSRFTILLDGSTEAIQEFKREGFGDLPDRYPGITLAVAASPLSASLGFSGDSYDAAQTDAAPVAVTLDGWTCSEPVDEKMTCHGPAGKASVEVVWRPARYHADYAGGNADKTGDYVSDVHGKWFATVDGDQAQAVGESLVWTD